MHSAIGLSGRERSPHRRAWRESCQIRLWEEQDSYFERAGFYNAKFDLQSDSLKRRGFVQSSWSAPCSDLLDFPGASRSWNYSPGDCLPEWECRVDCPADWECRDDCRNSVWEKRGDNFCLPDSVQKVARTRPRKGLTEQMEQTDQTEHGPHYSVPARELLLAG